MAIPARPIFGIPSLPVTPAPVVTPGPVPGATPAGPAVFQSMPTGGDAGFRDFVTKLIGPEGQFNTAAVNQVMPGLSDIVAAGVKARGWTGYNAPPAAPRAVHTPKTFTELYAQYFPMLGKLLGGVSPTTPTAPVAAAPVAPGPVVATPQPTVPVPTALNTTAGLLPYLNGLAAR